MQQGAEGEKHHYSTAARRKPTTPALFGASRKQHKMLPRGTHLDVRDAERQHRQAVAVETEPRPEQRGGVQGAIRKVQVPPPGHCIRGDSRQAPCLQQTVKAGIGAMKTARRKQVELDFSRKITTLQEVSVLSPQS